jgi:predicted ATP-binding protein involved in virulence
MKIESIRLENFRGISEIEIEFNKRVTVFFGVNGAGKSSILAAINLLYSNIINKIVENRFKQGIKMELSDISYGSGACEVTGRFALDEENIIEYFRRMDRGTRNRTHTKNVLDRIYEYYQQHYFNDISKGMPIFVNYGVNRLVLDIPLRIRSRHEFDQKSALEKSIESKIDFRIFFEWFRNQEDYENQVIAQEDRRYKDVALTAVRNAAKGMFGSGGELKITRNPLEMKVYKDKKWLSVKQLSDGEKCLIALCGDLARRLALAYPSSKNPLNGSGVVLIDEIELHMHPQWQRKTLPYLLNTFPNIQFIITTHSPQVLGELDSRSDIFSLVRRDNALQVQEIGPLNGWDSNSILEDCMSADSLNADTKTIIRDLYDSIDREDFSQAKAHIETLTQLTDDSSHPDIVRAEILIKRKMAKS